MGAFNSDYKEPENMKIKDILYYTFFAIIFGILVIYYFFKIIKRCFYKIPFSDEEKYINCHCSKCKKRYEKFKIKIKDQNINKNIFLYNGLFLLFLLLFIETCKKFQKNNKIIFNPYEILQISESASVYEIKKAYKQLTLKYHPDKNQGDKKSKELFMKVNKAYRALTNPKAKDNYEKYGNPDGPGLLQWGYALISFLFKGQVGYYSTIITCISMIVFFPVFLMMWYKNKKRYNSDGLLVDDLPFYYNNLNKETLITELPYIIGMSKEFNEMEINYDESEIKKLFEVFIPYFPKEYKYENISFKNSLAITILYIHFSGSRVVIEDNQFREIFSINEEIIVEKSLFLIDQLIKMILEINKMYEYNKGLEEFQKEKKSNDTKKESMFIKGKINFKLKEYDFNLIKILLALRARVFHETNIKLKNDELLQFPDNKSNIPFFEKKNYTSLLNIINDGGNKFKWLQKLNNYNDIEQVISVMPKYKLESEIKDTKIQDGLTLLIFKIIVTRGDANKINSSENEARKELGFLHSNTYTNYYEEEAMIMIIDKDSKRVNHYEKIKFGYLNEIRKIEYDMLVENHGKNNFGIYLFSLNYPGIEINQDLSIKIDEKNNLLNNFIENRKKDILPQEEFEKKYGLKNFKNNVNDKHKRQN